ncbi:MAG TPA: 16S rRNA (cytosine(967)-C(5))-methyltransferase RsmB [Pyrinomonadaceae bacterium]|jgi:16S rRNA (cytosine967-C5)-methyltransferase
MKAHRASSAHIARKASPARRAAFEILRRVEDEEAFAAPLLASVAEELRADDRALCYELVLGCLRRQLWLDRLMEHLAGRAAAEIDAPARRALRLGLYQLRFLSRVPASAAVNESVNLVHEARLRSAAGFVNAVLRRSTREPEWNPAANISDEVERVAVETSHPSWLVGRWMRAFGAEAASAFARANNETPPVGFRVNRLRATGDEVLARLGAAGVVAEASRIAPDGWRVRGGSGGALLRELASEGVIYMQDEASQLVAHVLGAGAGERVLDACAAPGSKTTHIALLGGDGVRVVAGDRWAHRLRLVNETAARLGLQNIRTVVLDAEEALPFADESFDRALVDAPCTGTGTLRHNPEIRWRITPTDITELAAKQQRILSRVARTVRPGGRLVYSTCSVELEENEEVINAFLAAHKDFRQVAAKPAADNLVSGSGAARTWPQTDGVDGFFVVAFERVFS